MTQKHAEDLKTGDRFFHDQLKAWTVWSVIKQDKNTVLVRATYPSGKAKNFTFGKHVTLDIAD